MLQKKTRNTATRIAILVGGPSPEHEISIITGQNIQKAFNGEQRTHIADLVHISLNKQWMFSNEKRITTDQAISRLQKDYDVAFIALHGPFGEDGIVQGLLESSGIRYTGSNVVASAIANDKKKAKQIIKESRANGLLGVLKDVYIDKKEYSKAKDKHLADVGNEIGFPCVVKPNALGSSYGITIVNTENDLESAITRAFEYAKAVIVEPYMAGQEITCGVFEQGDKVLALPPTEVIPKNSSFFDYKAKYGKGESIEITPAKIDKSLIDKIKRAALHCHTAFGCRGISRTDFIVKDSNVYFLELNTIPGMTETSLVPQQLAAAKIPFEDFLKELVRQAYK